MANKKVIVAGGGYAGMAFLRHFSGFASKSGTEVTLIDESRYHAIKSRFHERAVSSLREPGICFPIQPLAIAAKARFIQDKILSVDFTTNRCAGYKGEYDFDILVLAMGGVANFHGIENAHVHTYPIDTLENVRSCARALEELRSANTERQSNIIVCGAGIEGIEVATQIRQSINPSKAQISLIDGSTQVLPRAAYPSERAHTEAHLRKNEISISTGEFIDSVSKNAMKLVSGKEIASDLIIWCGGVSPPEINGMNGREPIEVNRNLQSISHGNIFAMGDCAKVIGGDKYANMASAQRAVYHGELCAKNVAKFLRKKPMLKSRYKPIGELVALGDWDGVGEILGFGISGIKAASLKKGNEVKYLAELASQLPSLAARSFIGVALLTLGINKNR